MRELMQELSEFGMVSGAVSEAKGGMGFDFLTLTMMYEEVCACAIDLSTVTLINTFAAKMLETLIPAHIQERYLPGMVKGELFVAWPSPNPMSARMCLRSKRGHGVMVMTTSSAVKMLDQQWLFLRSHDRRRTY